MQCLLEYCLYCNCLFVCLTHTISALCLHDTEQVERMWKWPWPTLFVSFLLFFCLLSFLISLCLCYFSDSFLCFRVWFLIVSFVVHFLLYLCYSLPSIYWVFVLSLLLIFFPSYLSPLSALFALTSHLQPGL